MPWEVDSEMDIRECSEERGGSGSGQREQSTFTAVSAGALANSTRSSEAGWPFRVVPKWAQGVSSLHPVPASHRVQLPQDRDMTWGKSFTPQGALWHSLPAVLLGPVVVFLGRNSMATLTDDTHLALFVMTKLWTIPYGMSM